jgi:hypothetical protein
MIKIVPRPPVTECVPVPGSANHTASPLVGRRLSGCAPVSSSMYVDRLVERAASRSYRLVRR